MAVKERIRIGGRSARIQAEVHKAVKDLLAEGDRTELTVPMIAARAGVTPSTIYRRWGDLAELFADVAMQRLRPVADPENTGSTKRDLAAYVEQYAEEFSSHAGKSLLFDLFSSSLDAPHPGEYCNYTYDHLQVIADRASARGETFDVQEVIDHVIAPIMYRILFGKGEVTEDFWQGLLDRLDLK
ncbi:MAG: putative transcriptional regulator, TetR family [Rhizobium sp.]|nr:putative transcriptional regulator, TetR family [Rhizobium sp.]